MQEYFKVENVDFYACGLSLVIHPNNPMAPTVHANWRYFEMYDKNGKIIDQWFGGGLDLTPYYFFKEDAEHFHKTCKDVCDQFNTEYYNKFKQECDSYFFNKHRNEARGVGGLFFDYLKEDKNNTLEDHYKFIISVSKSFLTAYIPILKKRMNLIYTDEQKNWQEIRRGRYVEFNLVHDKGTIFGLRTNGRIESILMSLPPKVQWKYDFKPKKGSAEEKLLEILKSPRNWI
jgi:coproporphyrinogen III oxidase